MKRCTVTPHISLLQQRIQQRQQRASGLPLASIALAVAIGTGAALLTSAPVQAQTPAATVSRPFPAHAQYGTLVIGEQFQAYLNGDEVRVAPGLRIFNPQNQLVHPHLLKGQKLRVNYVVEPATGYVQTAWILAEHEMPARRWLGLLPPAENAPGINHNTPSVVLPKATPSH